MTPGSNSTNRLRAIIAVIAVYAFVLQGFLGGLMPIAGDVHALCLSSAPLSGDPSPDTPVVHPDCCTAAQIVGDALAMPEAAATIAWPTRRYAVPELARHVAGGPRAPPRSIAHPRGPPVV